jgi:hypothetical protein
MMFSSIVGGPATAAPSPNTENPLAMTALFQKPYLGQPDQVRMVHFQQNSGINDEAECLTSRCSASIDRRVLSMPRLRPDRSFVEGGLAFQRRQPDPGLDVLRQIFRVPRHAGKSARAPGIKPRQSEEVHTGD